MENWCGIKELNITINYESGVWRKGHLNANIKVIQKKGGDDYGRGLWVTREMKEYS